jgi:hypothetical protein
MEIAFIYALAAICTRTYKSASECRRTTHDRQETRWQNGISIPRFEDGWLDLLCRADRICLGTGL